VYPLPRAAFRKIGIRTSDFFTSQFLRIEEPRIVRIFYFAIYVTLLVGGLFYINEPQGAAYEALGDGLISMSLGLSVVLGGLLGALAVLLGIWWVERLGIISSASGLLMFLIALGAIGASQISAAIIVALILTLCLRWLEVRKYQRAPGR